MPSSYVLGPHFEKFVREQISSGRYNNASEVIRDALRLLEERQNERRTELDEVLRKLDEGLADVEAGRVVDAEEAFVAARQVIARRKAQAS